MSRDVRDRSRTGSRGGPASGSSRGRNAAPGSVRVNGPAGGNAGAGRNNQRGGNPAPNRGVADAELQRVAQQCKFLDFAVHFPILVLKLISQILTTTYLTMPNLSSKTQKLIINCMDVVLFTKFNYLF